MSGRRGREGNNGEKSTLLVLGIPAAPTEPTQHGLREGACKSVQTLGPDRAPRKPAGLRRAHTDMQRGRLSTRLGGPPLAG